MFLTTMFSSFPLARLFYSIFISCVVCNVCHGERELPLLSKVATLFHVFLDVLTRGGWR